MIDDDIVAAARRAGDARSPRSTTTRAPRSPARCTTAATRARPMAVARWDSSDTTTAAIPAYARRSASRRSTASASAASSCASPRCARSRRRISPSHVYVDPAARTVRQCDEDYLLCERVARARAGACCCTPACAPATTTAAAAPPRPRDGRRDAETDRLRMIVLRDGAHGARAVRRHACRARSSGRNRSRRRSLFAGA